MINVDTNILLVTFDTNIPKSIVPIPINNETIKPINITFATVLLDSFSTSSELKDTFAWFKSSFVAIKICDNENITPKIIQIIPFINVKLVSVINKIPDKTTANELTIEQKITFENTILLALIGSAFIFRIPKPSRLMFVEQNVFVKTLKIKTTRSERGKSISNPIVLFNNDLNIVKQE